jgi:16S rRNA (cytosine1402-N4)-methyltransferase
MQEPTHVPVLLQESLHYLDVRPGGSYCDATLGLGGHSAEIARRLGAAGKLTTFDRDPQALQQAKARFKALDIELGNTMPTVIFEPQAFSNAAQVIPPASLDGLLADFGVSSLQLDEAHRGFSFRHDGPLDMRMNPQTGESAEQVVNQEDENVLADLIYEYGDERRSRRIARAIVRARPISTTAELARVISAAAPSMKGDKIHPATRTFQAIRIRVNDELGEIRLLLNSAGSLLKPGGRLVLISFHSLEDRIVKEAFKNFKDAGSFEILTRKPVIAAEQEMLRNPRSRSAKLRAAQKQGNQKQGTGSRDQEPVVKRSSKYRDKQNRGS